MSGTAIRQYAWGPAFTDGSSTFRLWAPALDELQLKLGAEQFQMTREADGWFHVEVGGARFREPYCFILPDGRFVPDPASRRQLDDVCGPSVLVDPQGYEWRHSNWTGRPWEQAVLYELHVGTFTKEGSFRAAAERLGMLADLGITGVEIMPLAHFPGIRGWGYDGVLQYAPHNVYGTPDDFKAFVDTAHSLGLMVFLDVVYNHFGPEGNYLHLYAPAFFESREPTPWGPRIAFEQVAVRQYFIDNVVYWLDDFRLDGLRFDAIDQIHDRGNVHILQEIAEKVRTRFKDRHVHLITENPSNGADLIAEHDGGRLFTADWNDDFHHVLHVIATGEASGYYAPFSKRPWPKLRKAMATGYLSEGDQIIPGPKIASASLPPTRFIHFIQNHDQVGNRALGNRLSTMVDETMLRALTEFLLLSPQIPLLFMGDDHLSSKPFCFFADYTGEIAQAIRSSRPSEAQNFGGLPQGLLIGDLPDPNAIETFVRSQLDWSEAFVAHRLRWRAWLKRLIDIRQKRIVPHLRDAKGRSGAIVNAPERCVFLDWTFEDAHMQLRANLSDSDVACERSPQEQIYPPEHKGGDLLPAMSVNVYLSS